MDKSLGAILVLAAVFAKSSAISCNLRLSVLAPATNGSGTLSCSAANSSCFSKVSYDGYHSTGCGTSCTSGTAAACYACGTDYCNTVTPSSISCYSRSGAASTNGTVTTCPTGMTACYSSTIDSEGGCGTCTSTSTCTNCNTNLCNYVNGTPAFLTCYYSLGVSALSASSTVRCSLSSGCFSYSTNFLGSTVSVGGCGNCIGSLYSTCRTCNTNLCNSASVAGVSVRMTATAASISILMLMKLI